METKNIKLIVAYDGIGYHGWQRQKNGITIQAVMEEKLETMIKAPVKLQASGRTDAGVHAMNQVCNFMTSSRIAPDAFKNGLNTLLPDDIYIKSAEYVPLTFHARYSARAKRYEYRIRNHPERDIFRARYHWHIRRPLTVEKMGRCLSMLIGTHDFSSFRSTGSGNTNPVRKINGAEIHGHSGEGLMCIDMEADGFLRHMVRNIVGTLVAVGLGKMDEAEFNDILAAKDRRAAGIKAPARGLFLRQVYY